MHFVARPKTRENDRIVAIADHVTCEVDNLVRAAKTGNENSSASFQRRRHQDKPCRLFKCEEVTRDIGMRDSDRLAIRNLPLKPRNDASARTENISKPHGAHARSTTRSPRKKNLRDSLRRAHDAVWIHGLVSRNHDE